MMFSPLQAAFLSLFVLAAPHMRQYGQAFTIPASRARTKVELRRSHALFAGKGFGSTPPPPSPKKEKYNEESEKTAENPYTDEQNMGQKALEQMRRERAEKRDEELRRVKEIRSVDEFVKDDPNAAVIPEKVAMRMGSRMLPFVGLPFLGGMGAFVGFWYFATYKNMEFQPSMVAATTIAILVLGLLGITYSLLSASWDPDREGSALGAEEFSRNLDSLKEGLSRSRENALIRERMAGMSEEEIQAAIRELDKRDEKAKRKSGGDDLWN